MGTKLIRLADNFWNIRGSFKMGGLIDVGTQSSLVQLANGRFVFLDAYTLDGGVREEIDQLTHGGERVEAVLNLHPFHTLHVEPMYAMYPQAAIYGTARHRSRFPDLPWEKINTEDPRLHARFADDFDFSVPRGVDFISANEHIHFSSVLAYHRSSSTIHVDDTLMYVHLPGLLRTLGIDSPVSFHPTLARALEKRAGAARDFRAWVGELAKRWQGAENLCAAHTATLTAQINRRGPPIPERILSALDKVKKVLDGHQEKYG